MQVAGNKLPKLYLVKKKRKELNDHLMTEIRRTPGNFRGAQQSVIDSIKQDVAKEVNMVYSLVEENYTENM